VIWLGVLSAAAVFNFQDELDIPRKVRHPFIAFDKIFRLVGPLLPFCIALPRSIMPELVPMHRGVAGSVPATMGCYAALSALRLAVYLLGHALVPRSMADHVLLGASVYGMLWAEVLASLKQCADLTRATKTPAEEEVYEHTVRPSKEDKVFLDIVLLGRAVLIVVAAFLASLLCADMYYTVRYFHTVHESAISVVLGLVLFQAPLACWLRTRAEWKPRTSRCTD